MFYYTYDKFSTHYNCGALTYKQWADEGHPNPSLGIAYIVTGLIFFILFIPCMLAMVRQEFTKHSCYKILIFESVLDLMGLVVSSFVTGYFTIIGGVYCMAPVFIYINGAIGMAIWVSTGMTSVLLVFNRILDLGAPTISKKLFNGNKTLLWLLLPTSYGLYYLLCTPPLIYNSNGFAYFFDPFYGTSMDIQMSSNFVYTTVNHPINNIFVLVSLSSLYTILCIVLIKKSQMGGSQRLTKVQKSLVIQSIFICSAILFNAAIYLYFQYFAVSDLVIIAAQFSWILTHGIPAFIALYFNHSMKNAFIKHYLPKALKKLPTKSTLTQNQVTKMTKIHKHNTPII
uniref:Serpentine Receptor, class T n=1 Tax=Rhabditophanes sp. KR3021 TaxID=114890 RepID=A0AC35TXR4_9BILA